MAKKNSTKKIMTVCGMPGCGKVIEQKDKFCAVHKQAKRNAAASPKKEKKAKKVKAEKKKEAAVPMSHAETRKLMLANANNTQEKRDAASAIATLKARGLTPKQIQGLLDCSSTFLNKLSQGVSAGSATTRTKLATLVADPTVTGSPRATETPATGKISKRKAEGEYRARRSREVEVYADTLGRAVQAQLDLFARLLK